MDLTYDTFQKFILDLFKLETEKTYTIREILNNLQEISLKPTTIKQKSVDWQLFSPDHPIDDLTGDLILGLTIDQKRHLSYFRKSLDQEYTIERVSLGTYRDYVFIIDIAGFPRQLDPETEPLSEIFMQFRLERPIRAQDSNLARSEQILK